MVDAAERGDPASFLRLVLPSRFGLFRKLYVDREPIIFREVLDFPQDVLHDLAYDDSLDEDEFLRVEQDVGQVRPGLVRLAGFLRRVLDELGGE